MKILTKITYKVPAVYNEEKFKAMIEDHLTWLRVHEDTSHQEVEPMAAYKFYGNLTGYLNTLVIPSQLHWIILRMNAMHVYSEFDERIVYLLLPSQPVIDSLIRKYQTGQKK